MIPAFNSFLLVHIAYNVIIGSSATEVCENQPADIGFLIDQSGSVGTLNFNKNLEAIRKFIDIFEVGPDALKISAFAFNMAMGDGFRFDQCNDKGCVTSSVNNINYYGGGEDFEMALHFADNDMFQKKNGMRDFSLKILIFFTDGRSNIVDGGYPLHQRGVIVYAVGVGGYVLRDQLEQIATNESYVFMISDYDSLIGQVSQNIRNKACSDILSNPCERDPKPCENGATCIPKGGAKYVCICPVGYTGHNCETDIDYCEGVTCANGGTCIDGLLDFTCQCADQFTGLTCELNKCKPFPADVVFVIDSSKSFSSYYMEITKQYIYDVTKQWEINVNAFQVAVVSFANKAYIELPFDDTLTNETFHNVVTNLTFRGGRSEIHLGLNEAINLLLSRNRHVFNIPAKKVIVLISDGLPSTPSAISAVTYGDIETFAVAIGDDVSHNYLNKITNGMDRVFPYHSDKLWHAMMNTLLDSKCGYCNFSKEVDLLFAVDTSASMSNEDLSSSIPSLLRRILSGVKIDVKEAYIALLTYHGKPDIRFNFTDYPESKRTDMERQLSYFEKGSISETNYTSMLEIAKIMLLSQTSGARDTSKKVLVILSRFSNSVDKESEKIIQSLKDQNIEIFVIGFDFDDDHFKTMSDMTTTSFHIGVDDRGHVDTISLFLSGLLNQLPTIQCKLP